jgi:PhzF family phenazine biosynthesis protein
MSHSIRFHQLDVFTRTPLVGNPAGVVLGADELSDAQMAAIAREMNLSETAFVLRSTSPNVVSVRFFTPTREVPVCGHATLAAHYVRARELGLTSGAVTQMSPGARWHVRWEPRDGAAFVIMSQSPVEYGQTLTDDLRLELLNALGIKDDDLKMRYPVQVVSTGHAKAIAALESAEVLRAIEPDLAALRGLSGRTGVGGYFLFARDDPARRTLTVCRMFGPAIGVNEDPVNGSGHGPLAAYLLSRGGAMAEAARVGFWSRMGDHLGRPGRVWAQITADGSTVEVGGHVTPVFSAEFELPR